MSPLSSPDIIPKSITIHVVRPTSTPAPRFGLSSRGNAAVRDVGEKKHVHGPTATTKSIGDTTTIRKGQQSSWVCSCCSFINTDKLETNCSICGVVRDNIRIASPNGHSKSTPELFAIGDNLTSTSTISPNADSKSDTSLLNAKPPRVSKKSSEGRRRMFQAQNLLKLGPSNAIKARFFGKNPSAGSAEDSASPESFTAGLAGGSSGRTSSSGLGKSDFWSSVHSDITDTSQQDTRPRVDEKSTFSQEPNQSVRSPAEPHFQEDIIFSPAKQEYATKHAPLSNTSLAASADDDDMQSRRGGKGTVTNKATAPMSSARWNEDVHNGWICGACTFVNDDHLHLACAVCGANRGPEETQTDNNLQAANMVDSIGDLSLLFDAAAPGSSKDFEQDLLGLEPGLMKARIDEMVQKQIELMEEYKKEAAAGGDKKSTCPLVAEKKERTLRTLSRKYSQLVDTYKGEREHHVTLFRLESQRRMQIEQETGNMLPSAPSSALASASHADAKGVAYASTSSSHDAQLFDEWEAKQQMLDAWGKELQQQQDRRAALLAEQEALWKRIKRDGPRHL